MALRLMFITNQVDIARIAETAGVDRIFVDMETVGKAERQGGMDTVQSHHTVQDVRNMRAALAKAQLFVRVNQIYENSQQEIDAVVAAGADIIMLPYFKTVQQVAQFLQFVNGRAKTCLLFETPESVERVEEILALKGIDECYIGLNDLHLGYQRKFMFELLADGTVDSLCGKFAEAGKEFGFGGIARIGSGMLSADMILAEHIRLGSSIVILSRSFCNTAQMADLSEIQEIFMTEVRKLREAEQQYENREAAFYQNNHRDVQRIVAQITEAMA